MQAFYSCAQQIDSGSFRNRKLCHFSMDGLLLICSVEPKDISVNSITCPSRIPLSSYQTDTNPVPVLVSSYSSIF